MCFVLRLTCWDILNDQLRHCKPLCHRELKLVTKSIQFQWLKVPRMYWTSMGMGMELLGIQQISAPSCFLQEGSGVGLWLPSASWGDSIRASQAWNQSLTPIKGCPAPPLWLSHLGLSTLSTFIFMNYMQLLCLVSHHICAFLHACVKIKREQVSLACNHNQLWVNQEGAGDDLSIHHGS